MKHKDKGMTLVEAVIYIVVISAVFFVVIETVVTITTTYRSTITTRALNVSGSTAMERMVRDIRNGASIDLPGSTLNSHPGKLTVVGGATTTEFSVLNGKIIVKENGVMKGELITGGATTTNLVFRHITTGQSSAVRIELSLTSGEGVYARSATLYSTVVLRNSY